MKSRAASAGLRFLALVWGLLAACNSLNQAGIDNADMPGTGGAASGSGGGGVNSDGGASAMGGSGQGGAQTGGNAGTNMNKGGNSGGAGMAGGGAGAGGMAGTGGMAGAGGGAGMGGMMCFDVDKDGQTTCAGDCDDNDPNNFKGNPELCGDMADNNCDGNKDENCMGLGTFVSVARGNDNNPGTKAAPVRTIGKGMQNARTLGGNRSVYVADGVYRERIVLVEGVDLLGGHECNATACSWQRDWNKFVSRAEAVDDSGMFADHMITRATLVDGFEIAGLDGAAVNQGRVALTINGSAPTITRNRIIGPQTGGGGYPNGRSFAIRIVAPVADPMGALIDSNDIRGGRSEADGCIGVGLEGPTNNGPSRAVITNNQILGGRGRWSNAVMAYSSGQGTLVERNRISAGRADADPAFAVVVGGTLDINANLINTDANNVGTCAGQNYCGGIESDSGTARITNNVVRGVNAFNSVGVILREAEKPTGLVILNGNTIDAGGTLIGGSGGSSSRALVLWIGSCTSCGFAGQVGRIRNNILGAGAAVNRYGVFEDAPFGRQQQPLAFENNMVFFPAAMGRNDVSYREWLGNAQRLLQTGNELNNTLSLPSGALGGNLVGDPRLDGTFHLMAGSPAIDRGTSNEAPMTDMDGEKRPRGNAIDIGADEGG